MRFETIWLEAEVEAVRPVTPSVREFELRPLVGKPAHFRPGAHIDISLLIDGRPGTRSYSLIGRPDGRCYRIAVKMAEESRGGSQAMWRLERGASLIISEPKNAFSVESGRNEYLLVAGGIGITPLIGMAEELLSAGASFRLLHAARSHEELAYRERLSAKLGERYLCFASEGGGRIDLGREFAQLGCGALTAICGPIGMLDAAKTAWRALDRRPADLRWETFGSSGTLPTESFRVRLPRFGRDIEVPASRSLLEALEDEGIEVIHDCKRGECGLCTVDILGCEGAVDHRDVFFSEHQKHENRKLCSCVSRAHGTIVIDTAYRPD